MVQRCYPAAWHKIDAPGSPSHSSPATLTVLWDCCCPAFHHSRCSFLSSCSYCWQGMPTLVLCEAVAGHIILPSSPDLRRRQTLHLENGIHPIPTMLWKISEVFWGLSKSSWEWDTLFGEQHVIWRTACAALGRRPGMVSSCLAQHQTEYASSAVRGRWWSSTGHRPVEHRKAKATGDLWCWGGWWQNRPCGSISRWHQQPGAEVRAGSGTTWLRWLKTLGLYSTLVAVPLLLPTSVIVHGRENGKYGWGRYRWVSGVEMSLLVQFA